MQPGTLSILLSIASKRQLAIIVGLAGVGAMTEGIGFVLLVPLLALLLEEPGTDGIFSPMAQWVAATGWSPTLGTLLAGFAALVTLRAAADFARIMISLRQSMAIVDDLRERAFSALLAADWRVLSRMRQSDNRAMLISEIDRTSIAIDQLGAIVRIGIGLTAIACAALAISPQIAAFALLLGGLVLLLYAGLRRRARNLGEALGQQFRNVHGLLDENLGSLRVIKSFGAEDAARQRVLHGFRSLREVRLQFTADSTRAQAMMQIGAALSVALLVWLAIARWDLAPVIVLPLVALFARALPQLGALIHCWQAWSHAAPAVQAAHRLITRAEADAEIVPGTIAEAPPLTSAITLDDICLSHREGIATLRNITLTLHAGETAALVGPSGAGKSTLADILGGLLAPESGAIMIDGIPLDPAMRQSWRRHVAYVDQDPVLFHGTVRDNLLWAAGDADDAQLKEVLTLAAADFVHDLPAGLDCAIGEGGKQLSGGERQRIVLARALLRDPALLILDEATSALDAASDAAVASAIAAMAGQRTILIIGHRGALTDAARRVITLVDGQIISDQVRS